MLSHIILGGLRSVLLSSALLATLFLGLYQSVNAQFQISQDDPVELGWFAGNVQGCEGSVPTRVTPFNSLGFEGFVSNTGGIINYPGSHFQVGLYEYVLRCISNADSSILQDTAQLSVRPLPPTNPQSSCTPTGANLSWGNPGGGVNSYKVFVIPPSGESCAAGWFRIGTACFKNVTNTSIVYPTASAGAYSWRVYSSAGGFISKESSSASFNNCAPTNNAQCTAVSVPTSVQAGQPFTATFTVTNTGATTWSATGPNDHLLGIVPATDGARWGNAESLMSGTTAPGGDRTFSVSVTAPTTLGTYPFNWQMVQRNVGYFGNVCTNQITVTPGPENGMCGTAHLTVADSSFDLTSAEQCRSGVPRSLDAIWLSPSNHLYGFQWTCNGRYGGTDSTWCQAYRPPQCGSAHGTLRATMPVDQSVGTKNVLCYVGLPNNNGLSLTYKVPGQPIADYIDKWVWKCDNSGSPLGAVQCESYKYACSNGTDDDNDRLIDMNDPDCSDPTDNSEVETTVNGSCGTAQGGSYATAPASNLCATGSSSWTDSAASDGTYNWSCLGSGTGSTAQCVASKPACSNGTDDDWDTLVDMNDPDCSDPADPSEAGGAVNGVCGTADGGTYVSAPASNLCTTGSSSWTDSAASDGTYNWSCLGSGGGINSPVCAALKGSAPMGGSCGTAQGGSYATAPVSNLCQIGGPIWTDTVGGDGSFNWNCDAALGGQVASCTATNSTAPQNGQCATEHYSCIVGTSANWQSTGGTQWTWMCNGVNGGSAASCAETSTIPSINLTAANAYPTLGGGTTLSWTSVNNPTNCKLYIDKPRGSGRALVASVQNNSASTYPSGYPTVGINEPTTYEIECDAGVRDSVQIAPGVYSVPRANPVGQQVYENEPFSITLDAHYAASCYYTMRKDGVYQMASYYEPRFMRGRPVAPTATTPAPIQDGRDGWTLTNVTPTLKRFTYNRPAGTSVTDGASDAYYWNFSCEGLYGNRANSVPAGIGMTVNTGAAKARPTVNAGPDRTVVLPATTASLDATITDPDSWIAYKTWVRVPSNAPTNITSPLSEDTEVTLPSTPGTYTFRLMVRDDLMNWIAPSEQDIDVIVTVLANATDCPATTIGNCTLPGTSNGGTAGACATSYTGSCNYQCDSGVWKENGSNTCTPTPPPPPPNCISGTVGGNCSVSNTAPGGTSGSCLSGHTGTCTYTCTSGPGNWNENTNTCTPATITQFTICDAGGNCANPNETLPVPPGAPLTVTWSANNAQFCNAVSGTGFATGGVVSGTDSANAPATPNVRESYTIICGNNTSPSDTETIYVQTNPVGPDINSPTRVVTPGTQVPIGYDVGASDPASCTITGPGVNFVPTSGSGFITPTPVITSRTTYTIDCGSGLVDSVTIELRPEIWET